jgi:DNA-binding CsgD family transcriptional regulator
MGESSNIDARMQAALARLTDNEKECLRRRLNQQTAKEMALELGISPHAARNGSRWRGPSSGCRRRSKRRGC